MLRFITVLLTTVAAVSGLITLAAIAEILFRGTYVLDNVIRESFARLAVALRLDSSPEGVSWLMHAYTLGICFGLVFCIFLSVVLRSRSR